MSEIIEEQPDQAMLERWAALPQGEQLVAPMTRAELNDLIVCLRRLQDGVAAAAYAADAALSGGHESDGAQAALQATQDAIQSMNFLTRFMNSFMARTMGASGA